MHEVCNLAFVAVGHDHRITAVQVPSGTINGHLRVARPIGVMMDKETNRLFVSGADGSYVYVYELVTPAGAQRKRAKWRSTGFSRLAGRVEKEELEQAKRMVGAVDGQEGKDKWTPPTCAGKAWVLSQVLSFPGHKHAAGMALGHSGRLFVA